jgi:proteasome lid subunit RPN8/RPN11
MPGQSENQTILLPFERLEISPLLREEMIAQARAEAPNECCGLLAGHIHGMVGRSSARFPIANDLASPELYLTNAQAMLFASRAMREQRLELLAIYHSHPTSEPVPSALDLERNTYGHAVVHLIVSLLGAQPTLRCWWLLDNQSREAQLDIR